MQNMVRGSEQIMAKYISTKEYKQLGPVAYRQWRADSHCNKIHGYALSFKFEFESGFRFEFKSKFSPRFEF